MAPERTPWQELQPGMDMPLAIMLTGPPDDSFQIDHELLVWTFRAGGWIRFKAHRVMDWGKPIDPFSTGKEKL